MLRTLLRHHRSRSLVPVDRIGVQNMDRLLVSRLGLETARGCAISARVFLAARRLANIKHLLHLLTPVAMEAAVHNFGPGCVYGARQVRGAGIDANNAVCLFVRSALWLALIAG